jgi:Chemotaxis response regulator containing a CheY-like receiver domain and a methylesterase domain
VNGLPIRVLVVDDSPFMRQVITDLLAKDPDIVVIGTARNGQEALEKAMALRPDVITLDLEMPVMDGLAFLQALMARDPLPVIVLSSLTHAGAEATIRALELGAVDVVAKPSGAVSLDLHKVQGELVAKIKAASRARVARQPGSTGRDGARGEQGTVWPRSPHYARQPVAKDGGPKQEGERRPPCEVVLIGASTGGPRALQAVLAPLPADFPAPVLVVQHMPPGFTRQLAGRLDQLCRLCVVEAQDGMPLKAGTVYIAPGDFHLVLAPGPDPVVRLTQDPPRGGHRPSVDVLFASAANVPGLRAHLVVLTGMGSDGVWGARVLKERGQVGTIIAEDASTCVVFGMPRALIEAGLADRVVPLGEIPRVLMEAVTFREV